LEHFVGIIQKFFELFDLVEGVLVNFLPTQLVESLLESVQSVGLSCRLRPYVDLQLVQVLVLWNSGVQEHLQGVGLHQVRNLLYFLDKVFHLLNFQGRFAKFKNRLGQVDRTLLLWQARHKTTGVQSFESVN
jgi:hypothetical protein